MSGRAVLWPIRHKPFEGTRATSRGCPTPKIATKQATYTLEQLHAELAGKIRENHKEARRLAQAMRHVEAVLKLLVPGYDVRPIAIRRRKPNPWFKRGTVLRRVLAVLREAKEPMTAREITDAVLAAHGVKEPNAVEVRKLAVTVQICLRASQRRDSAQCSRRHPRPMGIEGGYRGSHVRWRRNAREKLALPPQHTVSLNSFLRDDGSCLFVENLPRKEVPQHPADGGNEHTKCSVGDNQVYYRSN